MSRYLEEFQNGKIRGGGEIVSATNVLYDSYNDTNIEGMNKYVDALISDKSI